MLYLNQGSKDTENTLFSVMTILIENYSLTKYKHKIKLPGTTEDLNFSMGWDRRIVKRTKW
jgi:hypothetical protein